MRAEQLFKLLCFLSDGNNIIGYELIDNYNERYIINRQQFYFLLGSSKIINIYGRLAGNDIELIGVRCNINEIPVRVENNIMYNL